MEAKAAHISLLEICHTWLINHEKHPNSMWKIIPLAVEAVRELTLTSLPLVQHRILTRPAGQTWFDLPDGYTEYVRVGWRNGDSYVPLGISHTLLPFASYLNDGDWGNGFGNGFNGAGQQQNWMDGDPAVPADFDPADFSSGNFLAVGTGGVAVDTAQQVQYGLRRTDTVVINAAQNQILTGPSFTGNEIYLVYVAIGTVDTMTHIPVVAQAAIESYIDWKYIQNKRGGIREGGAFRQLFIKQHQILRARLNPITVTDIKQLRNQHWRNRAFPAWGEFVSPAAAAVATTFYFGILPSATLPTEAEIEALTALSVAAGGDKIITFINTTDEWIAFAYPSTETDPTDYYVGPLDNGALGAGGTFAEPVTVGAYRVILSNYQTQIPTSVTFS